MEIRVNIGDLDTLVRILRPEQSIGSQGETRFTFTENSKVYAKVERNASEFVANTNLEEGRSIELTTYKIPGLTTRWRVSVEGVTYEITGIDPISRVSPLCILSLQAVENG